MGLYPKDGSTSKTGVYTKDGGKPLQRAVFPTELRTDFPQPQREAVALVTADSAAKSVAKSGNIKSPLCSKASKGLAETVLDNGGTEQTWRRRIGVEPTADGKACHRF